MSRKGVSMKIWLVALLSFLVFLTIVQFVRSVYVNFSNTHQVIDNTNEAVRICGENNVAAVTTTGFTCNPPKVPVIPPIQ